MAQQTPPDLIRKNIADALGMWISKERQRDYQRRVEWVSVPDEIACWWDDFYQPDYAQFRGAFSEPELQAMARFDREFSRIMASLPNSLPPLEDCLRLPEWSQIAQFARETLLVLNENG